MKKKLSAGVYKVTRALVKVFYPRIRVWGQLPQQSAVIVGNHCQMNGPIACELYTPGQFRIWCAGEMMALKEVPQYAYRDFWSQKPRVLRPFYKVLSYLIAPLSVCVFNNARTIGVYHDTRVLKTFKATVESLGRGEHVVIFPEKDEPYNEIVYQFQDRFVDVAKLYHRRTGKNLAFVPMYLAPKLKGMYYADPVYYDPQEPMEQQRQRISRELMERITELARQLPEHRVVPYRNIPKKDYPWNTAKERVYEKTGG